MAKEDPKMNEKTAPGPDTNSGQEPNAAEMTKPCEFTLKVINQSGTHYYEVESNELGDQRPVTEEMLKLIKSKISLVHEPKPGPVALFCGTFIVNLGAFKSK